MQATRPSLIFVFVLHCCRLLPGFTRDSGPLTQDSVPHTYLPIQYHTNRQPQPKELSSLNSTILPFIRSALLLMFCSLLRTTRLTNDIASVSRALSSSQRTKLAYEWVIDGKVIPATENYAVCNMLGDREVIVFLHGLLGNGKVSSRCFFVVNSLLNTFLLKGWLRRTCAHQQRN